MEGVTVVEGPNEAGKTSMPEALDLLLKVLDSSSAGAIRSVKPVGRDVGPEAEIEMSSDDYRFVYAKRWLRDRFTTLEVVAPQHEQLTGREAHDRVNEMLEDTLDQSLWAALRIDQGKELALPNFGDTSLGQALDRAAGGQFASEREDDLWNRIRAERDRYWTARGQPKADRKSSETKVGEAQEEVQELERRLREIESDADEVSRLAADEHRRKKIRVDCEQQVSELSEQWDATETLRSRVQKLDAASEAAAAKRDSLASEQKHRQAVIGARDSSARRLETLVAEAEQAAPALAAAVQRSEDADRAVETARKALRAAEKDQHRANEDRDHHDRQINVELLQERYKRVVDAEQALSDAETRLETAMVDDERVAEIEQANLAAERAEAAFASGAASVETTATQELSLRIDGEEISLLAGETKRTVVDIETELTIPDVAVVRVASGSGSKDLGAERRDARDLLRRLCEAGDVADLNEARRAARDRNEAQRRRNEAVETIARDLRDLTVEVLQTKIVGLSKRIASYADERPDDPPLPPDFEAAKRNASQMGRVVAERRDEFTACQTAATRVAETLAKEQLKEADLNGQVKNARGASRDAERHLATARQERADASISDDLATETRAANTSRKSLEEAEAELRAADPDSLKAKLDSAREAVKRATRDLRSNQERQIELRSRLELRGEQGLHTLHDEAVIKLRHLEREHESTEARARAALLLHDTFERRRREARQRYMEPFRQRIEQLGRIVFNSTFAVDLDDDLRVARRALDGDTLRVDQLSTGAQEQIGVLSRLACAAIVSPDGGGAPVVIDDALGWSDPDRLRSMGAAIAAAGKQCQVIILTCTPGRYAHIGNATTIRLPTNT